MPLEKFEGKGKKPRGRTFQENVLRRVLDPKLYDNIVFEYDQEVKRTYEKGHRGRQQKAKTQEDMDILVDYKDGMPVNAVAKKYQRTNNFVRQALIRAIK